MQDVASMPRRGQRGTLLFAVQWDETSLVGEAEREVRAGKRVANRGAGDGVQRTHREFVGPPTTQVWTHIA